ncbi:MAG TPA: ABC transporter permease subunit [Acidimicrobiia bacterium]|nr:ABC transporter permease subunit [Acidimicrobiia bacterium]
MKGSNRGWVLLFLLPALIVIGALVVYPVLATIWRSLFDRIGTEFVGLDNYRRMLELTRMRRAIFNSFIWVAVFPIAVTTIGLVLAVLSEKVGWRTAFRLILFVPAAIAALSSGIIWRIMYQTEPSRGVVNAAISVPMSMFSSQGKFAGAAPSYDGGEEEADGSISFAVDVGGEGGVAYLGLVRIPLSALPDDAVEARDPQPLGPGTLSGVVWRDTRAGEDVRGAVDPEEMGIPRVPVRIIDPEGTVVDTVESGVDGTFEVTGLDPGPYRAAIPTSQFSSAWGGIPWLGSDLITLSAIIAGIWIWGGFALIVIGAGLAALPRETLEAARVDGATEWQVFRRVTVPQLTPVLGVVFVSLTIGALKMFDLILGIAPGSVQADANVIALEMWRTSFSGLGERGLGSAIAVFLFVMIIPVLAFNIRRFKLQEGQ